MFLRPDLFAHIPQERHCVKDVSEHVLNAKRLEREHGQVPGYVWLVKNGYQGLYLAKKRNPELFEGIVFGQNKMLDDGDIAARVKQAEQMAKSNGGVLPAPNWLRTHGYSALVDTIKNHAGQFQHIEQQIGRKYV